MTTATAAKSQQLVIQKADLRVIGLHVKGTAPLVINRFSQKAMIEMQETQEAGQTAKSRKKRAPKDFEALFEAAKHVSDEGWEGIAAPAFRNGAIDACRACGYVMTKAKMALMIEADGFDRVDGSPLVRLTSGVAEQWIAPTRNATGVVDLRSRPLYRDWGAFLRVKFDAGMLTASDVVNLISRVGQQIGVGEGRPFSKNSAGLGFGLFEVVNGEDAAG